MSFHSWLQNLRATLALGRGQSYPPRRGSPWATAHRPHLEVLEDRLTPSFDFTGGYSVAQFYQMTGPDVRYSSSWLQADFNEDGWNDVLALTAQGEMGTGPYVVDLYLSREDGTFAEPQTFGAGYPYQIAVGDFNVPGWPAADGRPDFAIFTTTDTADAVYVYRNHGPGTFFQEYTYVTEGNTGTVDATFGVSLEYATDVDVTVHYQTADDRPDATATAGSDYISTSGDVIIPAGQTSATFTVPVIGDRLPEPTESFLVWVNGQLAYGVILDDEVVPQISVGDATVTEGNAGAASATFAVTLSSPYSEPITVAYATADGSATAGTDYQAASGTLTFAPGETSKTITVPVVGDRLPEPNETFAVHLSSPTNATIADGQGDGTIVDDEPRISIGDVTKREGKRNQTTQFTFTVTLSVPYDQPVTVSFQTVNGTATTSDGDYVAKAGTLTFAPGETTKTITIEVKGDSKKEASETFYLDLFGSSSNALFTYTRGIGTILNDD
jgi:hypothetical protein